MNYSKVKVWLARNKDGQLNMFLCKPVRGEGMWFGHGEVTLEKDAFQYIDWQSEPVKKIMKLVPDDGEEEV